MKDEGGRMKDGVPEGWERVPLGEVMTLQRGHDLPSQDRVEGDVPIVSSSGITGFHDKKKADAPGVVTGRYGTLGQVYYIDRDYWPLNTALYVTDIKGSPPLFILHLLKHALESIQSDKAAIPGLNRNVVHSMNVLRPPAALRAAFGDFAADLYRQISILTAQTQKLRTARDLLLPRLMSGEIEV
ncbi:MAG: restriction endonuclease subunit S, partial [Prosthecobacter sp.]|nr:restriction endonuclease subunit S [Prosthecobacter sp.]